MLAPAAIKRLIEPAEVAEAVAFLCSPAADVGDRQLAGHGRRLDARIDRRRRRPGPARRGRVDRTGPRARRARRPARPRPHRAPAGRGDAARGRGLPLHVLLPPAQPAAALAPGRRRRPEPGRRRRRPRTPRGGGTARIRGRGRPSTSRRSSPTGATRSGSSPGCCARDGVPAGTSPAASGCTSGRWSTAHGERRHALPLRLGAGRHRRRRRGAPGSGARTSTPSASSRRPRVAAQPAAAHPGDPAASWSSPAACTPRMDLYKWAYKLGPAVPGELVARLLRAGRATSASSTCAPRPTTSPPTATRRSRSRRPRARRSTCAAQRGFADAGRGPAAAAGVCSELLVRRRPRAVGAATYGRAA